MMAKYVVDGKQNDDRAIRIGERPDRMERVIEAHTSVNGRAVPEVLSVSLCILFLQFFPCSALWNCELHV